MNTELLYLLLTAVLTGLLWVPVVIGYVTSRGLLTAETYKVAPTSPLPDWVNRANRAHANAVENFAPFAAVVLVGQAAGAQRDHRGMRSGLLFRPTGARRRAHQRYRPADGAHGAVFDRLGGISCLCRRTAAARLLKA